MYWSHKIKHSIQFTILQFSVSIRAYDVSQPIPSAYKDLALLQFCMYFMVQYIKPLSFFSFSLSFLLSFLWLSICIGSWMKSVCWLF